MAREKKFSSLSVAKEKTPGKLMETIVEDVIKAKTMTIEQWDALSENHSSPLFIRESQGPLYRVTRGGKDAADLLSQQSWNSREDLRQTIHREAFRTLSFQAIGDTLRNCQSRLPAVPDGHVIFCQVHWGRVSHPKGKPRC